ncbi:unnamed protein product [Microthlaspi erraticum]|uniref:Uncharacterized protein n=1 Tax=Microthlaspi erraticum TaxID=1685480 RepID=A0A6D2JCT3_9BRAS|nr:unnamed protein product [Microthlaspi erraticum]
MKPFGSANREIRPFYQNMSDWRQDETHGKIWCIPRPGPLRIGFGSLKKRPILFLDVFSAQYQPIHVGRKEARLMGNFPFAAHQNPTRLSPHIYMF